MSLEVLVVDDNTTYTQLHCHNIVDAVLSTLWSGAKGNMPVQINKRLVSNYADGVDALQRHYDLYVVDGQFPNTRKSKRAYPLGVKLIRKIIKAKGSVNGVIFISSNQKLLEAARKLGVKYIINKHGDRSITADQMNYRDMQEAILKALKDIKHPYNSISGYNSSPSKAEE